MKILVTIFYGLGKGGAEVSTHLLCKELKKRGHEVVLASTGKYEGFTRYPIPDFKKYPFYVSYVSALKRRLVEIIEKEDVDVVYSQDLNTTKGAILAAKACKTPIAVHLRDYWFVCPKSSCMSKDLKCIEACSYSKILTCARPWRLPWDVQRLQMIKSCQRLFHDVDALFSFGGEGNRKLDELGIKDYITVYNCRDTQMFVDVKGVEGFKEKHGLKGKVVTFLGSFTSLKGFDVAVEIARRVGTERKDVTFLFVGDGDGREMLEGIEGVKHLGWVDYHTAPLVYRATDILVMPTVWIEPYGGVQIEAAAAGTAIIGGNVGGVRDGKFGVHIKDVFDVGKWVTEVKRLLDDDSERLRLGKEAQGYAMQYLDIKPYADKIEESLLRIIK